MDIAQYSIKRPVVTWLMLVVLTVGGLFAYTQLGRLEDPEFTIKEAMVYTAYPGASPREVEEEVTDQVEIAIQQLSQLKRVTSVSKPGMSEITVVIKDQYDKHSLPQVWDELRRKVGDMQSQLPPGAQPSIVYDDFGDVFGILYAVTGDGYSYKELKDYVEVLRRELLLVPGVAKVNLAGIQNEQIFVEISLSRLAQLGIAPEAIYETLQSQNLVVPSGGVKVGEEYIRISPTGTFVSVAAIGNVLVPNPKSNKVIYLRDIAKITRGYEEVPLEIIRHNGKPALTVAISALSGTNIVVVGEAINQKLKEIQAITPIGINIDPIYEQAKAVEIAVNGFVVSLAQALAIVIIVLLFFMGLRSGLLIGGILLFTVFGTLVFMYIFAIDLQRISLGALIIALGMLVDNAIVVTDGILVRVQQGEDHIKAASAVVKQTIWPLFGATVVGILAFAAIGLSSDSTGEYTRTLFYVVLISLLLSWFLAITATPLLCFYMLKPGEKGKQGDPYSGAMFQTYRWILSLCIKRRWVTITTMVVLLVGAILAFASVKQSFFPDSTTPIFLVDYWRAEGTDIRATSRDLQQIEKHVKSMDQVVDVTTFVGNGAPRFMLVYSPEQPNSSYGQLVVEVKDYRKIDEISDQVLQYIAKDFPNSEPKVKKIRLGPGRDAKMEARFGGPNPKVLRQLSNKSQDIMHDDGGITNIRDDWRQRVKLFRPQYSDSLARYTGISKTNLNETLEMVFSGKQIALYREGIDLIPIVGRTTEAERFNIDAIKSVYIWSPTLLQNVPIGQVVSGFETEWEDGRVRRRNRNRTITASSDPAVGEASAALERIWPKINDIELPGGYTLEWGGEYEDSNDAQTALARQLPVSFLAMIVIVILLFGKLRQPAIIWLSVPLSAIGVTAGLLLTNQPFGFMALLGFLSLTGMLIKNAIVLVDQIDLEIVEGKQPLQAILDSSVSRLRPVSMAAITTVLGMSPLLPDAFFVAMAVVIMFGLSFATVLTLLIVPVLYATFFKVKYTSNADS